MPPSAYQFHPAFNRSLKMPLTRAGISVNNPTRSAPIDVSAAFRLGGAPMTASGWATGAAGSLITLAGRSHARAVDVANLRCVDGLRKRVLPVLFARIERRGLH